MHHHHHLQGGSEHLLFDPKRRIPESVIEDLCALPCRCLSAQRQLPWHLVVAASRQTRTGIWQAIAPHLPASLPLLQQASHLMVLCTREQANETGSPGLIMPCQGAAAHDGAGSQHVYIALGSLLLGAAVFELKTHTVEAFDGDLLDEWLGLGEQGLTSRVVLALGYPPQGGDPDPFAYTRLPQHLVMSRR
ncbi:nitroreductase family protein [Aeromonas sp. S16(2024)]|uniref:nitroreductase family protein n=1 Tax=Aeromonas sp. S16(2024) TaxID=3242889 RepID=UPI0035298817